MSRHARVPLPPDDALSAAVDGDPAGANAEDNLLALTLALRAAVAADPAPVADPAFAAALRERLLAEPVDDQRASVIPFTPGRHRKAPARRRVAYVVTAAAAAAAAVLVVALPASLRSEPGRVNPRNVAVQSPGAAIEAGRQPLDSAEQQVDLLTKATDDPKQANDPALFRRTLDDVDAKARAGARRVTSTAVANSDRAALAQLAGWASGQAAQLRTLAVKSPAAQRPRVLQSVTLMNRVQTRATTLAAQIGCACLSGASVDDLGPVPCTVCEDPQSPPDGGTMTDPPPASDGGGSLSTAEPPKEKGVVVKRPRGEQDPPPAAEPTPTTPAAESEPTEPTEPAPTTPAGPAPTTPAEPEPTPTDSPLLICVAGVCVSAELGTEP